MHGHVLLSFFFAGSLAFSLNKKSSNFISKKTKGSLGKSLRFGSAPDVMDIRELLLNTANTKTTSPETVIQSLLSLEKLMREKNRLDEGKTADEQYSYLNGSWRLIFTTGTVDTQKKIGNVNYFPLKAVQTFDTLSNEIRNGIYLGDFEALVFRGKFEWLRKVRKLEFDFDSLSLLGFTISLAKGGAAKIGSTLGVGAKVDEELIKKEKRPFFSWIYADENIAVARGAGGGLALWKRTSNF